jgi:hypothetical protein
VKILGKVENLVCSILRVLSTVVKFGVTSTFERGKYPLFAQISADRELGQFLIQSDNFLPHFILRKVI